MDDVRSAEAVLAELVVDSWRFAKDYWKIVLKLDANEQPRFANKLNYYLQRLQFSLEQVGMKIVDLENQQFEVGMAADVLNGDEFSKDDVLVVDQVLEPVIIGSNGIVMRAGKIMVRKATQ
jgi:hypothetical protein